jgi:hypothetical protein
MSLVALLNEKNRELANGFITEKHNPDGTTEIVNQLDNMVNKKKEEAINEERTERYKNYNFTMVTLILSLIVICFSMLIFFISTSRDFTGIYFDKHGNKIHLYYSKFTGNVEIISNQGKKNGIIEKITNEYYSLKMAYSEKFDAYIETSTHNIIWRDDIWYADLL